jgi:hypothetical protein
LQGFQWHVGASRHNQGLVRYTCLGKQLPFCIHLQTLQLPVGNIVELVTLIQ